MSGAAVDPGRGADQAVRRRTGVLAVDGLDLDVPAGSVFGLLGPERRRQDHDAAAHDRSRRHRRPASATIDGTPVDPRDPGARRAIGVLDQDPRYYGWMTGRELVELAGRLQGLAARRRRGRGPPTSLERVGLAEAAGRRIGGYSGGMRQRLGIAQALVAEPASADPRRARQLARPGGPARPSRADRRAARAGDDHLLDPRPVGRGADLRPGRRSSTRAGSSPRGRSTSCWPATRCRSTASTRNPGRTAAVAALATRLARDPWVDRVTETESGLVVSVVRRRGAPPPGSCRSSSTVGVRLAAFERVRPSLEDVFLRLVGRAA